MSQQNATPQPLFRHNWRTYVRLALAPLVLIELVLVATYLITNMLIREENTRAVRVIADQELSRIVAQEASVIGRDLMSVEQLTNLYRRQTELAYRTPFIPSEQEQSRYRYSSGGAWYTAVHTGVEAAAYYSALTHVGEAQRRKAWQLSQLDPLMAGIMDANLLVAQVYLNTHDSHNRIYPFVDTIKQFGESLDIPTFNFYYEADAKHNPRRETVWTEVYVDPAGQGWMMSCIAPVYSGDLLEAVVGLDVTVKTIIERILALRIPWYGYGLLLDHNGVIMAMPAAAEADLRIAEVSDHQYTEVIQQDRFKPEEFNIYTDGPLRELADLIGNTASGISSLRLAGEKLIAWATVPQTGWKLIALVPEQALYAQADAVGVRFQRLGLFMATALVLFYLVFFSFLYLRSKKASRAVASQLEAMERMAQAIGDGDYEQQASESDVLEIQRTANRLVEMGRNLKASRDARLARERGINNILETTQEGFWLIDNDTQILKVNPAMCAILARPMEKILGHRIFDFVNDEHNRIFQEQMIRRARGETGLYEISLSRPDGSLVPCLFHATPLFEDDGRKIGAFALVSDITERRASENALREAKEAAEVASKVKSEFLSSMSHEIRTPLNGVLGMVELLRRSKLDQRQRHYVETIEGSGKHLLGVIEGILDFSKIEAGRLEMVMERFDLASLVKGTAELFSGRASAKGVELQFEVDRRLAGGFNGDPVRLRQVLYNLIDNAVKFTDSGSVVVCAELLAEHGDTADVQFEVTDTGIGIAAEVQKKIFDAFGQADSSTSRRFGGTGLGLPIGRQLVALMGGELGLESEPGKGAAFRFALSLQRNQVPADSASAGTADSRSMFDAHVLLAEDNSVNREVAVEMLEQLGCRVTAVGDGHAALQACTGKTFDLVLMDLHMPGLDGLEATLGIRRLERERGDARVPIIAVTADVVQGIRNKCSVAGMDNYLSKPFTQGQLCAVLGQWLQPLHESTGPELPTEAVTTDSDQALDQGPLDQIRAMQRPGKPNLLQRVIGLYREGSTGLMRDICASIETVDADGLRQAAHSLKSASANLGAVRLSALAKSLEELGRSGDITKAQDLIDELDAEYNAVLEALSQETEKPA